MKAHKVLHHKLIFLHILKCGGTSMREMLAGVYPADAIYPVPIGEAVDREYPYPVQMHVNPLLHQTELDEQAVGAHSLVMSHYDWGMAERLPSWDVLVMFRDPVAQLYSLWQQIGRTQQYEHLTPYHDDFEQWLLQSAAPYLNMQTRFMSKHGHSNVAVALAHLAQTRVIVGLVEAYAETVEYLNWRYDWQMELRHANQSHTCDTLPLRVKHIAEHMQHQDMLLYRAAVRKFDWETMGEVFNVRQRTV